MALLDQALAQYGANDYAYKEVAAKEWTKKAPDIAESITMQEFIDGALRKATEAKTARMMFEIVLGVPEFSTAQVLQKIKERGFSGLPTALQTPIPIPDAMGMGVVVHNKEDGTCDIMKILFLSDGSPSWAIKKFLRHASSPERAYVLYHRADGPWAMKKATQSMLERIPGFHVDYATVTKKAEVAHTASSSWEVPDDELDAGCDFIMKNCPEDNDENQQWKWIQKKMKKSSGTPIAGWPEHKIQRVADNKAKGSIAAAKVERSFPLSVFDLHVVWSVTVLPILLPLFIEFGVMMLGLPGIGKTPLFYIIAFMVGRYHERHREGAGPAGVRRGRMMDNFKTRRGVCTEAVFLDDPGLAGMDLTDLKHYMDVCFDETGQARYNPASFAANGMRGIADNEFDEDDEPPADDRTTITSAEANKLVKKPFGGQKPSQIMAVLKRTITFIAGRHALYIRLPNKSDDATIHRIDMESVAADWLAANGPNKQHYGNHKRGVESFPDDYEENLQRENAYVEKAMETRGTDTPEKFVAQCDLKLQEMIKKSNPMFFADAVVVDANVDANGVIAAVRHVPSTPENPAAIIAPVVNGVHQLPMPAVGGGSTMRRLLQFDAGSMPSGWKRLTRKTSQNDACTPRKKANQGGDASSSSNYISSPPAPQSQPLVQADASSGSRNGLGNAVGSQDNAIPKPSASSPPSTGVAPNFDHDEEDFLGLGTDMGN